MNGTRYTLVGFDPLGLATSAGPRGAGPGGDRPHGGAWSDGSHRGPSVNGSPGGGVAVVGSPAGGPFGEGAVGAGAVGAGPFGDGRPLVRTVPALRDQLARLADAGRRGCVLAVLDADPAAVDLRTELNDTVLATGSLLVPCVLTGPDRVHVGPWVKPGSTPCLGCFAPDLLPASDGLRLDETEDHGPGHGTGHGTAVRHAIDRGTEVRQAIGAHHRLLGAAAPQEREVLARHGLAEASRALREGPPGGADRSVWGRVLALRFLTDGRIDRSSWRAPKDPDCPRCGSPAVPTAPPPPRLSRLLHENSKLREHFRERDAVDSAHGKPGAPPAAPVPGLPARPLPDVREERTLSVEEAMSRRRSRRRFGPGALTTAQLAALLHYSAGVTGWAATTDGGRVPLRAAPSGGALYPLDAYVYARRVEGLPRGLYRYDPLAHALDPTGRPADAGESLSAHSAHRAVLDDAAAVVVLAATFARTQAKYLERGYRVVLLEAGHVAQNLQLVAAARRLRACGVTGFVDDVVNDVLGLPPGGGTQALYLLAVGAPPRPGGRN